MAVLYFRVSAQYDEVIRLRKECEKLEAQLKKMDVNKAPAAARALETQLASAKQQMMGLVTEAARVGATMEHDFKNGIYNASQTVNDLSAKITSQRGVIRQLQNELTLLKEKYRETVKSSGDTTGMSEHIKTQTTKLREQKDILFGLTQQQADARLTVKKLKDEYAAFKEEAGETVEANEKMSVSFKKVLGVIGGVTALKNFATELVNVRGQFQQLEIAFSTMLKSKEKADKLMSELVDIAAKTPFDLQGVASSAKQMLAYGSSAETVGDELVMLGNVAAGVGSQLSEIAYLYGTLRTQGRAYAVDIRQFAGRGIPIYEELAKVLGVTKDEVSGLVKEGKVGFKEVEQAFKNMTSESGIYYNLMQEQSKSLTGQLSNLGDAWDTMLNEIGKDTQGIASSGISALKGLIENYETVGKVLLGLIATYGTYKTATLALWVIEQARARTLLTGIASTKALTAAQAALNVVMKANPYVLVATTLAGVVSAMWAFHDSATESEKAQERLNKKQEEARKIAEEHKVKIDKLIDSSRDLSLSDLQRGQSLADLRQEYPKIFAQYDIETIKLADILKLKQQIAEEDARRAGEKKEQDFVNLESEIARYENMLKSLSGQQGVDGYVEKLKELRAERDILLKERGKGISEQFISSLKEIDISEFDRYISELEKRIKGKGENAKVKMRLPIDVKGSLSDEALFEVKDIKTLIDTAKSTRQSRIEAPQKQTTYQDDLAKAKLDWETAKKGYESLIKDQNATTEQVKKAREEMEAKEKAYKELGGTTEIKSTDKDKQKQEQEKLYDQLLQLRFKNQQDEINLRKEGAEKKRKQIELDYQKEYAEIQKLEKEWSAKNGGKLTQEQSIEISRRYTNAENKYNSSIASLEGGFSPKELEKSMNEYLSAYGNYIEKRNAIIALGEEKKHGKNEWEQKSIDEETKRAISDLDIEAAKTTSSISQLFGDMRDKTLKDLQEIGEKGKAALEFLKSGEWDEEKGLEFGITKEQFETISQSPEELKDISDALRDNKKAADDLRPAYDKVSDGLKKVFNSGNDTKKLKEGLSDIQDGMNDIMQIGSFLSDTFSSLGDAFGSDTLSGVADGINVAMDAMNSAMQGAQAGSMFGPIGAAAGAAIGLVTSLASSIAKIHDAKNEKRIQTLQDQIDVLDKSYEKLGDSIEKAYSKDASNLIDQQNKLLEQQKILIQQQIREEQDKKKTDDERIKEWQQQIEDINKLIEDNKEAAVDAIFGEDLKSAIDDFASAYAEAWANGENRAESAKETVKNMMRQMVTESIKAAMQSSGAMEKIRQKLQEFYSDNVLSSWEQDYIYSMAEELQKELDRQFGWADSLMKDEEDKEQQSASSRGFGTEMTHEDAGELSGRFTAVYESNLRIETATQQQTVAITELRGSISALTSQVSGMYNIADETRTILANSYLELQQIRENTGEIVKPIKQIQADIAEVKQNTSRL